MIHLRSVSLQLDASARLYAILQDVPGTRDCQRASVPALAIRTREGTRVLSPLYVSLLLSYTRLCDPPNLRLRQLCSTDGCINADHWEKLPSWRTGRVHVAQTPEEIVPPQARRPLPPPPPTLSPSQALRRRGESNPRHVLTEAQARQILVLRYHERRSYAHIAATLGLNQNTVTSVANGKNWRWLWIRQEDGAVQPPPPDANTGGGFGRAAAPCGQQEPESEPEPEPEGACASSGAR